MHPLLLLGILGPGGLVVARLVRGRRKLFVSYYYAQDRHYKNLLTAWSSNERFDFEIDDVSADVTIQSDDPATIRRVLSRKIRQADGLLVLVGERSHRRKWVRWEIAKAKELRKPIIAVKIKPHFESPKALLSSGAVWARTFSFDAVQQAMDQN